MRIISGTHKGRNIPVRKNFAARPTTDFAKENLFNILNNNFDFDELNVLDLFGGTGSISFEFASRGTKHITCIEKDFKSAQFIRNTSESFKFDNIKVIQGDVFKLTTKLTQRFDIIFADPPFDLKEIETLPDIILDSTLLNENAWFILEHSQNDAISSHPRLINLRKYGKVNFAIFGIK